MTGQRMKEQNKYDQMPSIILNRMQRIFPLADKVADEIVGEETDLLYTIMPRVFQAMQKIAKFLSEYLQRGSFSRWPLFWIPQILMTAERARDVLIDSKDTEMLQELDGELANVIEDFLRAVDVETLRGVKMAGKHLNIAQAHSQ